MTNAITAGTTRHSKGSYGCAAAGDPPVPFSTNTGPPGVLLRSTQGSIDAGLDPASGDAWIPAVRDIRSMNGRASSDESCSAVRSTGICGNGDHKEFP